MPLSQVHRPPSPVVDDRSPPALNTTPTPFENDQLPSSIWHLEPAAVVSAGSAALPRFAVALRR
jgi:hypothetical protein